MSALPATISHRAGGHYRLSDAVRSEWTKFLSLRSTRWTLLLFPLASIGFAILIGSLTGSHYAHMSAAERSGWDPTNNLLAGLIPGYIALPVLGVLMMSSEYGSGSIRSTLSALPRRPGVLAAKAIVFAAVSFVVCVAVSFAVFFAGQAVMGSAPRATLGQPGVVRALVMSAAFLVLMGLFGLGLGAILRRSAAAVGAYAGLALVLPVILQGLPGHVGRFGPIVLLGNGAAAAIPQPNFLAPWAAFGLMAIYAAVSLGVAAVVFQSRDA